MLSPRETHLTLHGTFNDKRDGALWFNCCFRPGCVWKKVAGATGGNNAEWKLFGEARFALSVADSTRVDRLPSQPKIASQQSE
jgi:hypothetical protein